MNINKLNIKLFVSLIFIFITIQISVSQIEVSGTITDCENNKLIGASISIKKNRIGVISNMDGGYKIIVPDTNTVITFSYVGYQPQKIKVGNKKTIDVSLKENIEQENEVILVKKPAIYLYPQIETEISLKIDYDGKLLFTYPEYKVGWNVTASPNGTLRNNTDNREYSYLFWEGEKKYNDSQTSYSNGFVVYKDSIVDFLQDILPKIGLNPNEYNEFIIFWVPYLQHNDWNFIHFRIGEDYNIISRNIVNPKPDTEIRVFMEFKKVDKPFEIEPQKIMTPLRKGFTLVEWGGAELKQPITPFYSKHTKWH